MSNGRVLAALIMMCYYVAESAAGRTQVGDASVGDLGGGASLFGSTINLAKTIIGTGILAVPYGIAGSGLAVGLAFTVITAVMSTFSLVLLGETMPYGGSRPTLNSVATRAAGSAGGVLIDLSVLCNCFGAATSYLIVASTSVQSLLGPSHDVLPRQAYVLIGLALVFPLCLLRQVNLLRFTSFLAVVALVLLSLMIVLFAMPWWGPDSPFDPCAPGVGRNASSSSLCGGEVVLVNQPLSVLRQFVVFTNAYTCQQGILPILAELESPTRRRRAIVACSAVGIACILFLLVGAAGYLTFGSLTESDILMNYPSDSPLMSAARIGIILDVLTTYPLNVFYTRISMANLLRAALARCGKAAWADGATDAAAPPPHTNCCPCFISAPLDLLAVAIFIGGTTAVALVVSDLGVIVDLTGATGATMLCYIAPGFLFASLFRSSTASTANAPLVTDTLGSDLLGPERAERGGVAPAPEEKAPTAGRLMRYSAITLCAIGCLIVPATLTFQFLPTTDS